MSLQDNVEERSKAGYRKHAPQSTFYGWQHRQPSVYVSSSALCYVNCHAHASAGTPLPQRMPRSGHGAISRRSTSPAASNTDGEDEEEEKEDAADDIGALVDLAQEQDDIGAGRPGSGAAATG